MVIDDKRVHLDVYLSDCTLENEPDLLRSTLKAGFIARALAIYRVNRVIIYRGKGEAACREFGERLETVLRYSVIPPYLKKKLVPKRPLLRYVGIIPPLQIDTHLANDPPLEGDIRLGIIRSGVKENRLTLDIGLKKSITIDVEEMPIRFMGKLVPVIYSEGRWRILIEGRRYLGFEVFYNRRDNLISLMKSYDGIRIGTSRYGVDVSKVMDELRESSLNVGKVAVVFGEPYRGLREIIEELGGDAGEVFDYFLNFIPNQGTKTVRVEEALIAVLQTLWLLFHV